MKVEYFSSKTFDRLFQMGPQIVSNMIHKRPALISKHRLMSVNIYQSMVSTVTHDFKSTQEGFEPLLALNCGLFHVSRLYQYQDQMQTNFSFLLSLAINTNYTICVEITVIKLISTVHKTFAFISNSSRQFLPDCLLISCID